MKTLTTIIAILMIFSVQLVANLFEKYNEKNYVYDHCGTVMFVKVYIHDIDSSIPNSFLLNFTQEDETGHFFAIPVKKKRSDEEEDKWICPYCGTDNPASKNTCTNFNCPLYRKKGRDWHDSLAE
jgi:hypothetical protein